MTIYSTERDTTAIQRGAGVGHNSALQCTWCRERSFNQTGWGRRHNLVSCPACVAKFRAEKLARESEKARVTAGFL